MTILVFELLDVDAKEFTRIQTKHFGFLLGTELAFLYQMTGLKEWMHIAQWKLNKHQCKGKKH